MPLQPLSRKVIYGLQSWASILNGTYWVRCFMILFMDITLDRCMPVLSEFLDSVLVVRNGSEPGDALISPFLRQINRNLLKKDQLHLSLTPISHPQSTIFSLQLSDHELESLYLRVDGCGGYLEEAHR
eukprot:TRINITY_DN3803_c0_g1_i17.p1 TRINITY_DN3803_c0_g1~~TRINITY_DN3803_c0_g1_i17.p1  ORF type:complete len:128 (-),score=10.83 TRINITY_DN3803_c0_g1_i17:7-390(-)